MKKRICVGWLLGVWALQCRIMRRRKIRYVHMRRMQPLVSSRLIFSSAQLVVFNAIPALVHMAITDPNPAARKKSVYALSSATRNYQPALNELIKYLPEDYGFGQTDASDMEAVDS